MSRRALPWLIAGAFAAIFALRLVVQEEAAGLTFLYVLPITATALEWGRRPGILAGLLATGLYAIWTGLGGDEPSALGYLTRGLVFVSIGALTGHIGERLRGALEGTRAGARHFELARDMLCTATLDGRFVHLNDAWTATLGWTREELLASPFVELVHPDDRARTEQETADLADGVSTVSFANRYRAKDGSWHWLEWASKADYDRGLIYGAARDVTERRLAEQAREDAEQAVREAHARAVEASRMKSTFVANMSHEIRTPLNGVIGLTDLLTATQLSDEQREYTRALRTSGEALMGVIDDILDFSKIEAGRMELDSSDFGVRALLEGACAVVTPQSAAKGLELVAWCDPDVPDVVRGDGGRTRQVLTNLLSNAVKFTGEGEVLAHVAAERRSDGGTVLRFAVSDTGIGIEPAALDRLFDSFVQADSSTVRQYGGSGLGLTISKQLVELMGGAIEVTSTPGRGSRFEFSVPVAEPLTPGERLDTTGIAGTRVLVVDDNDTNRMILERQLASWGMHCDAAAGPAQALELLEAAAREGMPYGLALLDLQMPEMSGLELAREMKSRAGLRTIPTVLLTSAGGGRQEAREAGIDGFLAKPTGESGLHDEIARVIGSPRPLRAGQLTVGADLPVASRKDGEAVQVRSEAVQVLIAEDHPVNRLVALRQLEMLGYSVDIANDGRDAVDMSGERDYAAIFMDCQMPRLDGYEATAEIRRRERTSGSHTPIIAMTAHTMEGDRERCLAAGMDDYVAKPLEQEALGRALRRMTAQEPKLAGADATGAGPSDGAAVVDERQLRSVVEVGGADTDFVALFLEDARERMKKLAGAVAMRDREQAAEVAHALKGSAATVGAKGLADACAKLSDRRADVDLETQGRAVEGMLALTEEALRPFTGRPTSTKEKT